MKAKEILIAVKDNDWDLMLKLFPDGVEHRTFKYKTASDFTDWGTYDDFARYVYPAQCLLKDMCLNYVINELTPNP